VVPRAPASECHGFAWPNEEPLLPEHPEAFVLQKVRVYVNSARVSCLCVSQQGALVLLDIQSLLEGPVCFCVNAVSLLREQLQGRCVVVCATRC